MLRFFQAVREACPLAPAVDAPYVDWHRWSCENPERFWAAFWRFAGVIADARPGREPWDSVIEGYDCMGPPDPVLGPKWFSGARLNFAENVLRHGGGTPAVIFRDEHGTRRELSRDALASEVARVAGALRAAGVRAGDRVAGFLPNMPEAVIAMLAAAACGAVWSSCSPDFGAAGVLDRFGQIEPRVLFAADGYRYAGKEIDSLDRVRAIVNAIPSIERVVVVPFLRERLGAGNLAGIRGAERWSRFVPRQRAGGWRGDLALRWIADAAVLARRALDADGRRGGERLRRERAVPRALGEAGAQTRRDARPSRAAHDPLDRQSARRAQLRLCRTRREARRVALEHLRRHRHHLLLRARPPDASRAPR